MTPEPPTDHPEPSSASVQLRAELRQQFKQRRSELSVDQRFQASQAIAQHLVEYKTLQHLQTIAAFAATATEVDLSAWMLRHQSNGGVVALPRVEADHRMEFYQYTSSKTLEYNRYAIAEPPASNPHVTPDQIQAVLVPLVAFDDIGHRLGMGGGYYDRYLPRLHPSTPRIGVAFACQQYESNLPRQAWDVALHAVVTENGVLEWPQG